jgi:hypothetical protein
MTHTDNREHDERTDRLADYLVGRLPAAEQAALEAELLADAEASEALYAQVNLQSTIADSGRRAREGRWRRLALLTALPLAAALALLWLGPHWREVAGPPAAPRLRGDAQQVLGLEPQGRLTAPPQRFVWTATAAASRYRFELYDAQARLCYRAVLGDTVLVLAGSAQDSLPPAAGFWQVVPVDAAGRELPSSPPLHFETAAPSP